MAGGQPGTRGAARPDLGGFFCITMSENLTNCFSKGDAWGQKRRAPISCPRCSKRNSWDVIGEVIGTFRDGVRRHSTTAEIIAWDWAWGEALSEKLIPLLPKDTRLLSEPGGGEYMINVAEVGPRSIRNWKRARAAGIAPMVKTQLSNSWEISAVPYIPVMHLILEHFEDFVRRRSQRRRGFMDLWRLRISEPHSGQSLRFRAASAEGRDPCGGGS